MLVLPLALALLPACIPHKDLPTGDSSADSGTAAPSFTSEQLWSANDDWEPAIAADPNSSWVYQATTRIDQNLGGTIVVRTSSDGGVTWGADQVVSDSYSTYDPQLAVASGTGCVYVTLLGGAGGWSTYVRQSCDNGATWTDESPIAPDDWTTDHGWLLVSPDGDDVYVAFNATPPETPGDAGVGYVAVSHDAGQTFTQVHVTGDGTLYNFEYSAAMAPDGTIYVANGEFSQDYTGPAPLVLWRSSDKGATWETATVATSQAPADCAWADGCTFGFLAAQSAVAVDPSGSVLFLYSKNDADGQNMQVYATTSPGGSDWDFFSAPIALGVHGNNGFVTAEAGPTAGDFRVGWQGSADGPDPATWNTWYQRTEDDGTTWLSDPIKLSDLATGAPYKRDVGYAFPYGDYFDMSVDGEGVNHIIWAEGASWTGPGGTWWTNGI